MAHQRYEQRWQQRPDEDRQNLQWSGDQGRDDRDRYPASYGEENRNWHERYGRAGGHVRDERFGGPAVYGPQDEWNEPYDQPYGGGRYSGSRGSDDDYGPGFGPGLVGAGFGLGYGYGYGYGGRDPRRSGGNWRDERGYGYGRGGRNDDDRGWLERAGEEIASWFDMDEGGGHRGKGPSGYTRSDQRIEDDANDRLSDDPMVDATDIRVSVSGGEITLEGEVDSRQAKRAAEDCVDRVSGVKHVQNNLRVRQPGGTSQGRFGQTTG